jgi:hypothetical protein
LCGQAKSNAKLMLRASFSDKVSIMQNNTTTFDFARAINTMAGQHSIEAQAPAVETL